MEITATSMKPKVTGFEITFDQQVRNRAKLTPTGIRAKRIMEGLGATVLRVDGNMMEVTSIPGITLLEDLQAKIDAQANMAMELTFEMPIVTIPELSGSRVIKSMAVVLAAQADGHSIRVRMRIEGSLPLIQEDCDAVEELTGLEATRSTGSTRRITLATNISHDNKTRIPGDRCWPFGPSCASTYSSRQTPLARYDRAGGSYNKGH